MHKIPEDKHPISPHLTLLIVLYKISLKPKPNKMQKNSNVLVVVEYNDRFQYILC